MGTAEATTPEHIPGSLMATSLLKQQAAHIESLLPRITRRLFTLSINQPGAELPMAQMRACTFLLQQGFSPITELADELGVSVSAATQIADRLERAGFVERDRSASDRRVKQLALTDLGRNLMESRRVRRIGRAVQALESVRPEVRVQVVEALDKLLSASLSISLPGRTAADPLPGRQV